MQRLSAECLGTFILMFLGTGAVIANDLSGGAVTHVGVAVTFGLVVLAIVYSLGDVSGAHFNPAVTLGFWAAGRLESRWVAPYVLAQCVGAVFASLSLRVLFPAHSTLGMTLPTGTAVQAFVLELLLTLILMFVILRVSAGSKVVGMFAGLIIGATITAEALFGGPISGASMNPARSLAPALVAGRFDSLWIYLSAPFLGALAGIIAYRCVQPDNRCCQAVERERQLEPVES